MSTSKLEQSSPRNLGSTYILESASDRDRLYLLFDLWREDFHAMFRRALELGGLDSNPETANFRLIDVACGEGLVSADILDRYPKARSVGIERDPEGSEAGRLAYAHLENLQIFTQDVHTPFPPEFAPGVGGTAGEGFDFALLRLALGHFSDGAKVLRNVYSVLKPGGTILLFDPPADWAFFPHPSLHRINQVLCEAWKFFGTADAGARHVPMLRDAGFEVLETVNRDYGMGGESEEGQKNLRLCIETMRGLRKALVERTKVISGEEFDHHIAELRKCPPELTGFWRYCETVARKPLAKAP